MDYQALSLPELTAPLLFVLATVYLLGPLLPLRKTWARVTYFVSVWLVIFRYINWRQFDTVLPVEGQWYEVGWVWLCFGIEVLALVVDVGLLDVVVVLRADRPLMPVVGAPAAVVEVVE